MVTECFDYARNGPGATEKLPLLNSHDYLSTKLPEKQARLDMLPVYGFLHGEDVAKFEAVPLKVDPKRLEELAKDGKANKETIDALKKIGESIGNLTFENGQLDKDKLKQLQETVNEAAKDKKVDIALVMKEIRGQFEAEANGKTPKFRIVSNAGTFEDKRGGFAIKLEMKLKSGADTETYMEFEYDKEPRKGHPAGRIGMETFVVPKEKSDS